MESKFNLLYKNVSKGAFSIERNVDIVKTSIRVIRQLYSKELPSYLKTDLELISVSPVYMNRGNTWMMKDLENVNNVLLVTEDDTLITYSNLQTCIKEITAQNIFNFYIHFFDEDFVKLENFFDESCREKLDLEFENLFNNPPNLEDGVFVETALMSGKVMIDFDKYTIDPLTLAEREVASTTVLEKENEVSKVKIEKKNVEYFDIFKELGIQSSKNGNIFPEMDLIFSYTKGEEVGKYTHFKSLLKEIVYTQILYSGLNFILSESEHYDYELRINYYTYEDVNEMVDVIFNRHKGLEKVELKSDAQGNLVVCSHYSGYVTNERIILSIEGIYRLILGDDTYMFTNKEKLESIKNELENFTGKAKYVIAKP